MLSPERLKGLVTDLERIANNLADGNGLDADECAEILADIACELRATAQGQTLSLAEIRNGTGFPRGVRFAQIPEALSIGDRTRVTTRTEPQS